MKNTKEGTGICPNCFCEVPIESRYCIVCGEEIVYREKFAEERIIKKTNKDSRLCKSCHLFLEPDGLFCPRCGTENQIEESEERENISMFCARCGGELDEESLFCKHCGANVRKVGNSNRMETSGNEQEANYTKSRFFSKHGGKIIGIVAVLAIVLILANFHTCDYCEKGFIGDVYYNTFSPEDSMCEDCAKDYYRGINYKQFKK